MAPRHRVSSQIATHAEGRRRGDLEIATRIAWHGFTRTTQPYNRQPEDISLDGIERIRV